MRFFVLMLAFLSFVPAADASQACTRIGCVNGLNMRLPANMEWLPGSYVFTATTEAGVMRCSGDLPLPPCGEDDGSLRCTDDRLRVMESGCALPADAHSFGPIIQIEGSPTHIRLMVTRNGTTIVDQSFAPQYKTSRPNGPQCDPVCHSASVDIAPVENQ